MIKFENKIKYTVIVVDNVSKRGSVESAIRGCVWVAGGSTKVKITGDWFDTVSRKVISENGVAHIYVINEQQQIAFESVLNLLVIACISWGESTVYLEREQVESINAT